MRRRGAAAVCFWVIAAIGAAAQDQMIVVDHPLEHCATPQPIRSAALEQSQAASVIKAALRGTDPDPATYYIIHATEFVPGRAIVGEEHWYVYHAGWDKKPWYWWFADSRQVKRFNETRILGSSRVGLIYLYVNVPTYATLESRGAIAGHFRKAHAHDLSPASVPQGQERTARVEQLAERLRGSLSDDSERRAREAATRAQEDRTAAPDADVELIVQLETERYIKALGEGDRAIANELALTDTDTGEELVGLSPRLATTAAFAQLTTLFYTVSVTGKTPAPVENFKHAARLAFAGQSEAPTRIYVKVERAAVCGGGPMNVKHVPSDLLVTALTKDAQDEAVQRSKQTFDNEGKYWWDVSLALPLESRRDLTIDVDAGQVAAKQVDKADLFAVVNVGLPRDTKKVQWQLIPAVVYGLPITGKPLHHHLVGLTVGLNYVQLLGGMRFDRRVEVATSVENGTPIGVESPPAGRKWEREWVWGVNVPLRAVVDVFKNGRK
jgi:hypothetical protein